MRLRDAENVKQVGLWMQDRGISPGEHRAFGIVHLVHTERSLHYQKGHLGSFPDDKQGNLAIDANDRDIEDDKFAKKHGKVSSETDALTIVYFRILAVAENQGWPLDEMFFYRWGFRKETGYNYNAPIGGHDTHLHVGFYRFEF